jgi:regulator of RNase E activity RraA
MTVNLKKLKENVYSGILCDVMDGMGYRNQSLGNELRPLTDGTVIFGPAYTCIANEVYSMPENPLVAQTLIVDRLGEDEVLVLTTRGEYNCAVFGELFATAVNGRKGAGVLLDAYARDIKQIKEMEFPLFYKGTNPNTSKGRAEINESQLPVKIDGVVINPGDIIFGDIDGVCVIPKAIADEVFEKSFKTMEDEDVVRDALRDGTSLEDAYKINGAI